MRGKGLPQLRSSHRGDQLVKIRVDIPTSLSKKEKKLFEELTSISGDKETKFKKIEF